MKDLLCKTNLSSKVSTIYRHISYAIMFWLSLQVTSTFSHYWKKNRFNKISLVTGFDSRTFIHIDCSSSLNSLQLESRLQAVDPLFSTSLSWSRLYVTTFTHAVHLLAVFKISMISVAPKASTDWSPYAPRNDRERPSNRLPPVSPSDCGMGYSFDSKQGRCVGEWCLI